jgi:hypothetical protein
MDPERVNLMSIEEVSAEQLAELFHHYHETLAPDFGCAAKPSQPWERLPEGERHCLVAAARLALVELRSTAKEPEDSRRYFAKPGEAEWGC